MEWLFNHPEQLKYWTELFNTGKTDFDSLFGGFSSTVDFPGYLNYKALFDKYPESKVILTMRDQEEWYESALNTVYAATPQTLGQKFNLLKKMIFSSRFRKIAKTFRLAEKYLWNGHFEGRFKDPERTLKVYNDFNKGIIEYIPKNQLLVYNISEGWAPLCDFLKVPIPEDDFPFKNKRKEFKEQIKRMMDTGGELELQ